MGQIRLGSEAKGGRPVWLELARGDVLISGRAEGGGSSVLDVLRAEAVREGMLTVRLAEEGVQTPAGRRMQLDHLASQCSGASEDGPQGVVFIDISDGGALEDLVGELLEGAAERPYALVVCGDPERLEPARFASWIRLDRPPRGGELITGAQRTRVEIGPERERAGLLPVLSAQQAADFLEVTPGRVRQLVAAGELRRAPIPVRDLVLRRDDVESYAERRKAVTTLRVHDVPTALVPRELVYESLVRVAGRQLHVRLWRGEDGLAVLLVGHLHGDGRLLERETAEAGAALFRLIPGVDPAATACVELIAGDRGDWNKYVLEEVSFQIADVADPVDLEVKRVLPVEWDDLLRALGVRPELYHVHGYMAPIVEEHLRTRRPVPAEDDRFKVRQKMRWLEALDRLGDHPAVEPLTRLIVDELWLWARSPSSIWTALLDVGAFWVPDGDERLREAYEEALGMLEPSVRGDELYRQAGYPWAPTATRYVGVALPPRLRELVDAHPDDSFSYTAQEGRQLRALLLELERDHEEHRPSVDADLHAVAGFGLDVMAPRQRCSAEERHRQELELPRPSHGERRWQFHEGDPVSAAYLATITWQDAAASDFTAAEKADLDKCAGERAELERWGRAPDGDLVGLGRDGGDGKHVMVVQDIAAPRPVQEGDVLVSARITGGDIPLFLERDGQIMAMLPSHNVHSGMNYGYGGGGPGEAAAAVVDLLNRAGYVVSDDGRRRISRRMEDPVWTEGRNLRVPVSELLD